MVLVPVCQYVHTLRVVDKHFGSNFPSILADSMEYFANQTCATDLQAAASDECHVCGGAIEPGWRGRILVKFV
jgi:hypothetical protein